VASPGQQDGKTTVAVNLAIAYALEGRNVILVDADLRRPQIAARLGKEVVSGLDAVLMGERALEEALVDVDAGGGRLRILPVATPPPNPAVLLGSQRMRSLLAELAEQADIVLIDSPALLAVSDAIPLINQAAGTVLVARLNQTTKDAVQRTNQVISAAGGTMLGTVATGAQAGGLYGYYGYGYYDTDDDRGRQAQSSNGTGGVAGDLAPGREQSSS
jgi:capsular exopolysaccharide synthesis family protein